MVKELIEMKYPKKEREINPLYIVEAVGYLKCIMDTCDLEHKYECAEVLCDLILEATQESLKEGN